MLGLSCKSVAALSMLVKLWGKCVEVRSAGTLEGHRCIVPFSASGAEDAVPA